MTLLRWLPLLCALPGLFLPVGAGFVLCLCSPAAVDACCAERPAACCAGEELPPEQEPGARWALAVACGCVPVALPEPPRAHTPLAGAGVDFACFEAAAPLPALASASPRAIERQPAVISDPALRRTIPLRI